MQYVNPDLRRKCGCETSLDRQHGPVALSVEQVTVMYAMFVVHVVQRYMRCYVRCVKYTTLCFIAAFVALRFGTTGRTWAWRIKVDDLVGSLRAVKDSVWCRK